MKKTPLFSLLIFYFVTFGLFGLDFGYLPLYAQHLGFSPQQISVVSATYFIAATFFSIPWSYLCDRLNMLKWMIVGAVLVSASVALALPKVTVFGPFISLFFLYAMLQMVIVPQIEALAIGTARQLGTVYGRLRMMGTIGMMVATLFFGWFFDHTSIQNVIYVYAIIAAIQFLAALHLPKPPRKLHLSPTVKDLFQCVFRREMRYFLIAIFFNHMSYGLYYAFLSIFLVKNGYSKSMIGWMWFVAMASEASMMWMGHWFTDRFKASYLIMAALVVTVFRWFLLSKSVDSTFVIISQFCNIATFGLFHLAAMKYIGTHVPESLQQSGQALYQAVTFGLGAMCGTLLAGQLVPIMGIQRCFLVFSIIAMVAVIVFLPVIVMDRRALITD